MKYLHNINNPSLNSLMFPQLLRALVLHKKLIQFRLQDSTLTRKTTEDGNTNVKQGVIIQTSNE